MSQETEENEHENEKSNCNGIGISTKTTTTTTTTTTTINCSDKQKCEDQEKKIAPDDDSPYLLHKCIFEGDFKLLGKYLQLPNQAENLSSKDKHGNTPLHLAVMLGRKECIQLLLSHTVPIKVKNNEGWSPLAEAISYGDRETITAILRKLKQQSREQLEARRAKIITALKQMKDFYVELKWDFSSWLPLVSRMLPSDVCRIHKCGSSLRLDSTLVDFNDMRWERGDVSFIFRGDRPTHENLTVLDNEGKCYQHVNYEDLDIEDEVDVFMSTDILAAQMSTKSISFTRAQSGWIFRADRKEIVDGQYDCDLYCIQGLVLNQRKRREHLSVEDLKKNRAMMETIVSGGRRISLTNGQNCEAIPETTEIPRRCSLEPPEPPNVSWEEYLNASKCPRLARNIIHKNTQKSLRATVAMCQNFPLSVEMLLNVLEVIAPFKHISKLREFVNLKLPAGFPVKIEIPVLHTVTAKITFQKFEFRDNISTQLFEIPENYVKDARRFPDL